ncbi:YlxR family protein [Cellulosimicrobium terreum]|nr:YlxR family protein [Cellulosimicrobium terreum]
MPPDRLSCPESQGAEPVRTCVGCRARDLRSELLRLVVDRSGVGDEPRLLVDVRRALPGRGAWLHASHQCLEAAERRRSVARALRVAGPLDLADVRAAIGSGQQEENH